jgi:cobalt-precorrin-5B (C1)-methyltransferase
MSDYRTGFTTGTCASAAAKAATLILLNGTRLNSVAVSLPHGSIVSLPIAMIGTERDAGWAYVRKDAGDDPDVTHGCLITASVRWSNNTEITIAAGEGVGIVTKPGLAVPPGNPAINPIPRCMIIEAIRQIIDRGVEVTISIPDGEKLAKKTYNPKLGIEGGLSILGTSGIVRPFSHQALRDALLCTLNVAVAANVRRPIFVPGRIGGKAAMRMFEIDADHVIEVSNEWGFMLDSATACGFESVLVVGHPGKLAKICAGSWDTHSSKSASAVPTVLAMAEKVIGHAPSGSLTVEGVFRALTPTDRTRLAQYVAADIRRKISERVSHRFYVAVILVDLNGTLLGYDGDVAIWGRTPLSVLPESHHLGI